MIPNNNFSYTEGDWSSWKVIVDCIETDDGYAKLYRRECTGGKYCYGNSKKSEKCKLRSKAPVTSSTEAKAIGKVTLLDLQFKKQFLTRNELEDILNKKGDTYKKLSSELIAGLISLFDSNNINVKTIDITKMKTGSLKVDYMVKFKITNALLTAQDLNPVKKTTNIFLPNSLFSTETKPGLSEMLGICLFDITKLVLP